jgi:hypothetical protein
MERLGGQIKRSLAAAGVPDAAMLSAVTEAWPDTVGPAIARAAWPARIGRDGTLHVNAVSSTWAFELGRLGEQICGRLRVALGDDAPPALRVAPGPVPGQGRSEPTPPEAPQPTAAEAAAARDIASAVSDDALRETIRRAAEASLAARRSGRRF